jgi:hypothetical protein
MNKYFASFVITITLSLTFSACTSSPQASNTNVTPTTPPLNLETPKDSDLATDMNLYTNTKYGYAIQYPNDNTFKQFACANQSTKTGDDYFVLTLASLEKTTQPCAAKDNSYPIELHVTTGNQTTPEYFKTVLTDFNAKITPITFGQLPASKIELTKKSSSPGADNIIYTSVFNNGKTYSLQLTDPKYLDTYNKMVPTFKFIESKTK